MKRKGAYHQRIAESKAHLDEHIRNVVKKVSHRPFEEIVQIIRERTGAAVDRDYLTTLLNGG